MANPRLFRSLTRTPVLGLALLLAASCAAPAGTDQAPVRFEISVAPELASGPLDGRVLLVISPTNDPEPRFQGLWGADPSQILGVDVEGWEPGQSAVIDASTHGYPVESLADLPAGDYWVQAVLNVYTTFNQADGSSVKLPMDHWEGQHWNQSEGNLYSPPQQVHVDPSSASAVKITLSEVMPAVEPPADTKYVKHIRFKSDILSEWWGHDMDLGAVVVLPGGFDEHPNAHYPVVYWQGHFPRTFNGFRETPPDEGMTGQALAQAQSQYRLFQDWTSGRLGRFILVFMQHPTPFYDDSYAVNTANNGPYGDALTQELIPRVEQQFRGIGEPWARTISGGSTGGWESLAWQVFYPDMFNGTWTFCPDPVDFNYFQLVNIYEDENAFYPGHTTFKKDAVRPLMRNTDDQVYMTERDFTHLESVLGSRGRSGEQMDIFFAVFGPKGDDGYPVPLFDKWTGVIDPEVAQYWKENYDIRHILERDWATLGPKLKGKLHIYMGDTDTFYLEEATRQLEQFLESTTDPYYDGSFTWGVRQPHCYSGDPAFPGQTAYQRVLPLMQQRILRTAPAGADVTSWRY